VHADSSLSAALWHYGDTAILQYDGNTAQWHSMIRGADSRLVGIGMASDCGGGTVVITHLVQVLLVHQS
jgi:hypothetical protein